MLWALDMNYKLIAIEIGELIKWDSSINEINRCGSAIFSFKRETFPKEGITSERASLVYDWIMTLAKQRMKNDERNVLLVQFCHRLVTEEQASEVKKILKDGGIPITGTNTAYPTDFNDRQLHQEIHKHCKQLYLNGHYFHAVFEACKVYNKMVRDKSQEIKDGHSLMLAVWGPDGVLKITPCQSDTDYNVQNGIKFLSAGIMQAVRNPTAHEPAVDWPISKQDCLDILSLMSFLFRKLDEAVYYKEV